MRIHEQERQEDPGNGEDHAEICRLAPNGSTSDLGGKEQAMSTGGTLGLRRRGKCKWFNVAKGWGFITQYDGGPDVFVHQSVIKMSGFRSLGDDEEVEFECKVSEKGLEATIVTGPNGQDCKGSHRRPMSKKRFRKIRCYNCGEFANHIAAKCTLGPQPKRCHHCKSVDHLIAECPLLEEKKKTKNGESGGNGSTSTTTNNNSKDGSNNHRTVSETHEAPSSSGLTTDKRKV